MNLLDLALVVLIVATTIAGVRSGLLPQLGGLLGAAGGGITAIAALPWATDLLNNVDPLPRALLVLGGLLAAIVVGESLGSYLGRLAKSAIDGGVLGFLDGVAGALVGALQGVLVAWLTGGLLAVGPHSGLPFAGWVGLARPAPHTDPSAAARRGLARERSEGYRRTMSRQATMAVVRVTRAHAA